MSQVECLPESAEVTIALLLPGSFQTFFHSVLHSIVAFFLPVVACAKIKAQGTEILDSVAVLGDQSVALQISGNNFTVGIGPPTLSSTAKARCSA